MHISLIFTTYNSPNWLQKVLWGILEQQHTDFEVIIGDDGSTDETRQLIESFQPEFAERLIPLCHVWQKDEGFRKCRILNKAILHARSDYLVFTDGDCILRPDFIATHAKRATEGRYLSGSYYKLPMSTSESITREDITSGRCFDRRWLRQHGLPANANRTKLNQNAVLAAVLNHTTPTRCRFKGANASAWRQDVLDVGGFDERMVWGGLDRELGVRLKNAGIRPLHVRYDAVCVHLDHSRGYKDPDKVAYNKQLRQNVERSNITKTDFGINQLVSSGYQPFLDRSDTVVD
ncbi:MAG: glycosyltransferase family 2 protein [Gammaproteobacteria bacterium]|nr:glycosyltransferase family 2 protein [Gammaproteobacteria bacterium]